MRGVQGANIPGSGGGGGVVKATCGTHGEDRSWPCQTSHPAVYIRQLVHSRSPLCTVDGGGGEKPPPGYIHIENSKCCCDSMFFKTLSDIMVLLKCLGGWTQALLHTL